MGLPVNEVVSTIQGEGSYTGTPAVFVRLQFCPVGCPWCDTKHTWKLDINEEISFDDMIAKTKDTSTWADVSENTLIDYLIKQPENLIVITGGEPCTYDLTQLTTILSYRGKQVQIETSGTAEIKVDYHTFITVSPKIDMPGGLLVLDQALQNADEIKMPVGKLADVEKLKTLLQRIFHHPQIYLQPLSQSEKATELCIEQARLNGWRLSAQLHKYIHVR